ncbi:MAG: 2-amino-4-hydroxy-6-hydroxymethyldihydropteridine diphosphokinase [Candidatus Devosia phytovorans]|uniref:2-amino-4-hydroxy-6-hydroxymethyldihydropteridine pyrophosphokinase n=1 Tax=Candidatus Devosia phytovorans TaxID=3121372 RepID=A0AAJ6B1Z9_9HYPH|nr:2-amino-4-hydroxy-6-hydroxymethyldihydropteridine diphosphokinase [Devosia sp.]WEK05874.1 MAG: 2-amino-4-hydroxy-6-hydroxymethyldihydropteridine diphosphokinase [Devosia sp.]
MTSMAWLSLGANIGADPAAQVLAAVEKIDAAEEIRVTRQSSLMITKPWGKLDQPDFANLAIEIETTLKPLELLDILQAIELEMGRVRVEVWGPRVIDIDIIAYDQIEMNTPRLTLPHPHAHERDFVLTPLAEIAPDVSRLLTSGTARTH